MEDKDTISKIRRKYSQLEGREEAHYEEILDEIFKAGYEKALTHLDVLNDGKKIGRMEVVKWSNEPCILHGNADARIREGKVLRQGNCYKCWQAQLKVWFKDSPELLKEWGITDEQL